jgi:hypothetical protein
MQQFRKLRPWWIVLASVALVACQAGLRDEPENLAGPEDPFDYNYCGGVPVYPVVGISFSTFCGPRNQLALGRYGTLMWLFPSRDAATAPHEGRRKLSDKELKHLSLLTEVAQLADPVPPQPGAVNYRLGINFSGRATKRMHAVKDARYTPANTLFDAMLEMVPDKPELPECPSSAGFFDPNQLPGDRRPLTLDEVKMNKGYSRALD